MSNNGGGIDFGGPDLEPAKEGSTHSTGGVSPPHEGSHNPHPNHPHPHHHHEPQTQTHEGLVFPLFQPPLASYRTGGRFFGAPRTGRLHAAVDLLNPHQAKIRAIADGVVIQSAYSFYLGTNALEVHHPSVGTVRYGEIDPYKRVNLRGGDHVRKGDVIAYVGRLNGSGASMLHFELYSGRASGQLTVISNHPYERRSDLENPTSFVDRLLKNTFGH
jgi:murein DD-endopeptidase MepM/ murein hydrolase activator NlpD